MAHFKMAFYTGILGAPFSKWLITMDHRDGKSTIPGVIPRTLWLVNGG